MKDRLQGCEDYLKDMSLGRLLETFRKSDRTFTNFTVESV